VVCLGLTALVNSVVLIGQDFKKPIAPWRRTICKIAYAVGNFFTCLVAGLIPIATFQNTDYSAWLGPDYSKK